MQIIPYAYERKMNKGSEREILKKAEKPKAEEGRAEQRERREGKVDKNITRHGSACRVEKGGSERGGWRG